MRSRVLAASLLVGLASTAHAAQPNVYDHFRNASYSNRGLATEQEEIRLGAEVHQQVLQKYRLVREPQVTEYVEQLGARIAASSGRPNLQYHFFVVDDPAVNAFSLPGGFVYVNTGLLRLTQSEDELAAAMAHEIGHVVARHGLRNLKTAQKAQIGVGIASILGSILTHGGSGGRVAGGVAQVFAAGKLTQFSREFEREADYLGLHNMATAGFDPNGMVSVFQKLGGSQSASKSSIGGIFADHPDSGERVRNTQAEISQYLPGGRTRDTAGRFDDRGNDTRGQSGARGRGYDGLSFDDMKRALESNRGGRDRDPRNGRRRGNDPYDPNGQGDPNDPNDPSYQGDPQGEPDPGPYNPPPLRRRSSRP